MNISLNLDDASWQTWVRQLRNALAASDTILKKAVLIVWPRESSSHFERESGPEGPWAPWMESTRKSRISYELRRTSATQRAFARSGLIREGGQLLQITGKLRMQTTQDPELIELPNGLKVESPTSYSGYLDEGTSRMVARPFMWLGDDAQEMLSQVVVQSLWSEAGGTA